MAFEVDPIATKAWDCLLPMKCNLGEELVPEGTRHPVPCYFMVPRQGYFFLHTGAVRDSFSTFLERFTDDHFYFQCTLAATKEEIILPWQYPAGVILDLITARTPHTTDIYSTPLELTLRCERSDVSACLGYPKKPDVMPMSFKNIQRAGLLSIKSSIKSAVSSLYKSTQPWMRLPPDVGSKLDQSLLDNDPRAFFGVISQVRKNGEKELGQDAAPHVLFKFHVKRPMRQTEKIEEMKDSKKAQKDIDALPLVDTQTVIPRKINAEQFPTLGLVLRELFPCCYDLTRKECQSITLLPPNYGYVYICGSQPALCTPVRALAESLCCADTYVHVVLVPTMSNEPRERPSEEKDEGAQDGGVHDDMTDGWGDETNAGSPRGSAYGGSVRSEPRLRASTNAGRAKLVGTPSTESAFTSQRTFDGANTSFDPSNTRASANSSLSMPEASKVPVEESQSPATAGDLTVDQILTEVATPRGSETKESEANLEETMGDVKVKKSGVSDEQKEMLNSGDY